MAVCTNTEVFTFMGTPTDVQTAQGTAITDLITRVTEEFKQKTGRSAELIDQTSSAVAFTDGVNCQVFTNDVYLDGVYRDFYELTEVKEDGVALTEIVSSATQNNDYVVDRRVGKINRPWNGWLKIPGTIEIKGRFGLVTRAGTVGNYTYPTRDDVKQVIIEMVAALSGLWRQTIITENGALETTRLKITDATQKALDAFVLKSI